MAVVTEDLLIIELIDGELKLSATFDDVTDALTSFTVTNTTPRTLTGTATILKANGVSWHTFNGSVAPGTTTWNAGGSIKNWSDLKQYSIGVVI